MLQGIIEAIKNFFGFGEQLAENKGLKIPMQENAIREHADTRVIRQELRQDKILDRDLLKTEKILYFFDDQKEYRNSIEMKGNLRPLYNGNREDIIACIKNDMANILDRKQQKKLRKMVVDSNKPFFVIKIHPLTIHKEL